MTLHRIAENLKLLNQQAVHEYTSIAESIVLADSRNVQQIEHTLDGLLDFCGYEPALALFKKLCRHYWKIDPTATARHINAYREIWDSEESE